MQLISTFLIFIRLINSYGRANQKVASSNENLNKFLTPMVRTVFHDLIALVKGSVSSSMPCTCRLLVCLCCGKQRPTKGQHVQGMLDETDPLTKLGKNPMIKHVLLYKIPLKNFSSTGSCLICFFDYLKVSFLQDWLYRRKIYMKLL